MAKVLLAVMIAVLCISQAMATVNTEERDALVAIRTHITELAGEWSDTVLSELCQSGDYSTPYVSCKDGHVVRLYAIAKCSPINSLASNFMLSLFCRQPILMLI